MDFGIFLGLIAAAGVAYGGYRAMQEEGASFSDTADRLSGGARAPARRRPPHPAAATASARPRGASTSATAGTAAATSTSG